MFGLVENLGAGWPLDEGLLVEFVGRQNVGGVEDGVAGDAGAMVEVAEQIGVGRSFGVA